MIKGERKRAEDGEEEQQGSRRGGGEAGKTG